MPRQARQKSESGIYHVLLRGINRQVIFEDNEDMNKLFKVIKQHQETCKYKVYAYCFMSNHVHFLVKENETSISTFMKKICSSYVLWYNWKYERCGHLFQERYKSENIESDRYFLTVLRYIHQNPLKAGLALKLSEYRWSSYWEYLGTPAIVDKSFVLSLFSQDSNQALDAFKTFNQAPSRDQCLDLNEVHRLTDEEVKGHIYKLGVENISELQKLDRRKRDNIIKKMKSMDGVTVRQLSRITGIPRSTLHRIK